MHADALIETNGPVSLEASTPSVARRSPRAWSVRKVDLTTASPMRSAPPRRSDADGSDFADVRVAVPLRESE
jgi:hypothetical protein